ncbi:uncharacterized protein LOC132204490 [Neocloeon triangulifer]|uniref:uncharacterized protein LOC132204490 n=1 Tax=Neocloeon triangulifer TaxID=2078957 RepID=UPI00286EDEAA|nr:uncharacterized protein LOC132204490 [Neocloeon triangulifer]
MLLHFSLTLFLVSFGACAEIEIYNQADFFDTNAKAVGINQTVCASQKFESTVLKCCNTPLPSLLGSALIPRSCIKKYGSAAMIDWLNSYNINSLQAKADNSVTLTSKIIKTLCKPALFAECVFKANSWLNADATINVNAFKKSVTAGKSATWVTTLEGILNPVNVDNYFNAYPVTDIIVDDYETLSCSGTDVNSVPLMFMQLIQSEILWMCPEQKTFTNQNQCMTSLRRFQFCDGKIFENTGLGVFFFSTV